MRLDQTFVQLPFVVDAELLAAEIAALPEAAWRDHPEGAPGNTAIVLVGAGGDPSGDSTMGPMAPTPHLERLPYTRRVLAALGSTIGRTRLMRIATETELGSHVDTNYYWWHHLRVHVPVITTPDVMFAAGDDAVHMDAGEVWVFDTWRRHAVDNPAQQPRIHLVIDTVGSAFLWDLIEHPERERTAVAADGDDRFPSETANWPLVMAPSEVERTIDTLLDELATVDVDGAARARGALSPFRHEWRDLTARHGNLPDGWPAREALLQDTLGRAREQFVDLTLPNGIGLVQALAQLVTAPALTTSLAQGPGAPAIPARPAAPASPAAAELLAGPPRIVDPVFVVCPPRSGSSFLFETLQRSPDLHTIGGESHLVFEGIASLAPAAHDWDSNRLDASDASDGVVSHLKDRFVARMRDRNGRQSRGPVRLLEKTPKNALRVPFLAQAFPEAKFVYLYRDPRETVSSMLDAWRSGKFVTYPNLPDWEGQPWSLLLTPGWRELVGRPLGEIVAKQWSTTIDTLLDDLEALDSSRWCVAAYDQLVADPREEIARICAFLGLAWDDDLSEPLPDSRHTLDSPHPDKWRRNADELDEFAELIAPSAARARAVFAAAPRTAPVDTAAPDTISTRRATPEQESAPAPDQLFSSRHTRSFRAMLQTLGASLLVTTYQAGRLIMLRDAEEGLNSHFRSLPTPMGVAYDGRRLAIGTRAEIMVFQNQPALTARLDPPDRHDGCFVVRHRHTTGDIRVHDLAWGDDGLWVVNTRFSCLATLDDEHSFVPRWRPPWITALAAEDRCHLNGLCMIDGKPKYVTVLGTSDTPNGWRERKADGGAIVDVDTGDIVTVGLSMPHSPRWHDGKLYVLESGRGALCVVDPETGAVERIGQVPGFARGLTLVGQYAIIGLSRVREHTFDGLPLTQHRTEPLECGVWVVDTTTGETVAHLAFDGLVQEIFEVALLPGLRYPELVEPGASLGDSAFVLPDTAMADVASPGVVTGEIS